MYALTPTAEDDGAAPSNISSAPVGTAAAAAASGSAQVSPLPPSDDGSSSGGAKNENQFGGGEDTFGLVLEKVVYLSRHGDRAPAHSAVLVGTGKGQGTFLLHHLFSVALLPCYPVTLLPSDTSHPSLHPSIQCRRSKTLSSGPRGCHRRASASRGSARSPTPAMEHILPQRRWRKLLEPCLPQVGAAPLRA